MGQSFQVPYDGNLVLEQLRVEFPQPPAASELSLLKMDREGNGTAFSYAVRPESLEQYVDHAILLIGAAVPRRGDEGHSRQRTGDGGTGQPDSEPHHADVSTD